MSRWIPCKRRENTRGLIVLGCDGYSRGPEWQVKFRVADNTPRASFSLNATTFPVREGTCPAMRLIRHFELMRGIGMGEFKLPGMQNHQLAVFICLAGLALIRHSPREAGISRAYLFRQSPQTRPTVKSLQTLPGYRSQENYGASRSIPFRWQYQTL